MKEKFAAAAILPESHCFARLLCCIMELEKV